MDLQPMPMSNMHDTFWRENQIIAAFHSDTQLISADGVNNAPTILNHLDLESQLQKLNQFLKDSHINFTLSLFGDKDNPQGPPQPQTSSSNGEQTASKLNLPLGVYLFGLSKPIDTDFGQIKTSVVTFFNFKEDTSSASEVATSSGIDKGNEDDGDGRDSQDPVARIVNQFNRNLGELNRQRQVPISAASPVWLCGATGGIPQGCLLTPPMPVVDSSAYWHYSLPQLSPKDLLDMTGEGVTVFILDTLPEREVISRAAVQAGENNLLLLDVNESVTFNYNFLSQGIEVPGQGLLGACKDVYGKHYDIKKIKIADHGLFIAGIVRDIAPGAKIECIRVLDEYGVGDMNVLLNAMQYIENRMVPGGDLYQRPVVINMSLVIPTEEEAQSKGVDTDIGGTTNDMKTCIRQPIQSLVELGAISATSAGNEGDLRENPSGYRPGALYPAAFANTPDSIDGVIPVGAVDKHGNVTSYSCYPGPRGIATYGGEVPWVVPKQLDPNNPPIVTVSDAIRGIYSTDDYPPLSADDSQEYLAPNDHAWAYWVGTSFATPIISGVAARVLELKSKGVLISNVHDAIIAAAGTNKTKWENLNPVTTGISGGSTIGPVILAGQQRWVADQDEEVVSHAPRVLNANFADPAGSRIIDPYEGLVAGQTYDLLVDVGPPWSDIKSITTGYINFPDEALPPDQDGHIIQVVVVSEDFWPRMVSAKIWLPRQTGRSFPIVSGQRAKNAGPVALRLRMPTPSLNSEIEPGEAHARLCLYYENNLLQSGIVKVGITATEGVRLPEANTIEIDYALSGSFQELEERFARRMVKFHLTSETESHPITLNLTLNDDGDKGHRIIISRRLGDDTLSEPVQSDCPPRGWTPYDPEDARRSLKKSRSLLQSFFYQKSENNTIVLNAKKQPIPLDFKQFRNGKTREQFIWDLFTLAPLGRELYDKVFIRVNPEEGATCRAIEWMQDLDQALTNPSVIQIARTTSNQNYIFPWALLYSYPLSPSKSKKWETCSILDEWKDSGQRTVTRTVCPYHSQPWHQSNIICPYGFWGLKHIIEQPPSELVKDRITNQWRVRDAEKIVQTSPQLRLSIGVTRDTSLNVTDINQHLQKLGLLQSVYIDPHDPAEDWDEVSTMLKTPEVVYFLCHGEYDGQKEMSYLSIGPRDTDPIHKIYPQTIVDWAVKNLDIREWKKRHPLIFINGCHTADLKPGEVLDFVSAFIEMEASGVLGTEVSVVLPVAIEVAELMFERLARGISVGQALYEIRWILANKGNLLGLAYTLYGLADLHASLQA